MITALAFHIQSHFNAYLGAVQEVEDANARDNKVEEDDADEEQERREERMASIAFVVGELLQLATHMDYSDEIGRRKMFGIVSECSASLDR